jgi:hypothetical protein
MNLTLDHKSLENKGSIEVWLGHDIHYSKDIFKGYKILSSNFQNDLIWEKYECPKFWNNNSPSFGTRTWESQRKMTFGCNPCKKTT